MTREETYGQGAGGRFRAELPFARFPWGDWVIVEIDAGAADRARRPLGQVQPHPHAHGARAARRAAPASDAVEVTVETRPPMLSDRFLESLGQRRAMKRHWRKALRGSARSSRRAATAGERATIAGGPRKPATGLRAARSGG